MATAVQRGPLTLRDRLTTRGESPSPRRLGVASMRSGTQLFKHSSTLDVATKKWLMNIHESFRDVQSLLMAFDDKESLPETQDGCDGVVSKGSDGSIQLKRGGLQVKISNDGNIMLCAGDECAPAPQALMDAHGSEDTWRTAVLNTLPHRASGEKLDVFIKANHRILQEFIDSDAPTKTIDGLEVTKIQDDRLAIVRGATKSVYKMWFVKSKLESVLKKTLSESNGGVSEGDGTSLSRDSITSLANESFAQSDAEIKVVDKLEIFSDTLSENSGGVSERTGTSRSRDSIASLANESLQSDTEVTVVGIQQPMESILVYNHPEEEYSARLSFESVELKSMGSGSFEELLEVIAKVKDWSDMQSIVADAVDAVMAKKSRTDRSDRSSVSSDVDKMLKYIAQSFINKERSIKFNLRDGKYVEFNRIVNSFSRLNSAKPMHINIDITACINIKKHLPTKSTKSNLNMFICDLLANSLDCLNIHGEVSEVAAFARKCIASIFVQYATSNRSSDSFNESVMLGVKNILQEVGIDYVDDGNVFKIFNACIAIVDKQQDCGKDIAIDVLYRLCKKIQDKEQIPNGWSTNGNEFKGFDFENKINQWLKIIERKQPDTANEMVFSFDEDTVTISSTDGVEIFKSSLDLMAIVIDRKKMQLGDIVDRLSIRTDEMIVGPFESAQFMQALDTLEKVSAGMCDLESLISLAPYDRFVINQWILLGSDAISFTQEEIDNGTKLDILFRMQRIEALFLTATVHAATNDISRLVLARIGKNTLSITNLNQINGTLSNCHPLVGKAIQTALLNQLKDVEINTIDDLQLFAQLYSMLKNIVVDTNNTVYNKLLACIETLSKITSIYDASILLSILRQNPANLDKYTAIESTLEAKVTVCGIRNQFETQLNGFGGLINLYNQFQKLDEFKKKSTESETLHNDLVSAFDSMCKGLGDQFLQNNDLPENSPAPNTVLELLSDDSLSDLRSKTQQQSTRLREIAMLRCFAYDIKTTLLQDVTVDTLDLLCTNYKKHLVGKPEVHGDFKSKMHSCLLTKATELRNLLDKQISKLDINCKNIEDQIAKLHIDLDKLTTIFKTVNLTDNDGCESLKQKLYQTEYDALPKIEANRIQTKQLSVLKAVDNLLESYYESPTSEGFMELLRKLPPEFAQSIVVELELSRKLPPEFAQSNAHISRFQELLREMPQDIEALNLILEIYANFSQCDDFQESPIRDALITQIQAKQFVILGNYIESTVHFEKNDKLAEIPINENNKAILGAHFSDFVDFFVVRGLVNRYAYKELSDEQYALIFSKLDNIERSKFFTSNALKQFKSTVSAVVRAKNNLTKVKNIADIRDISSVSNVLNYKLTEEELVYSTTIKTESDRQLYVGLLQINKNIQLSARDLKSDKKFATLIFDACRKLLNLVCAATITDANAKYKIAYIVNGSMLLEFRKELQENMAPLIKVIDDYNRSRSSAQNPTTKMGEHVKTQGETSIFQFVTAAEYPASELAQLNTNGSLTSKPSSLESRRSNLETNSRSVQPAKDIKWVQDKFKSLSVSNKMLLLNHEIELDKILESAKTDLKKLETLNGIHKDEPHSAAGKVLYSLFYKYISLGGVNSEINSDHVATVEKCLSGLHKELHSMIDSETVARTNVANTKFNQLDSTDKRYVANIILVISDINIPISKTDFEYLNMLIKGLNTNITNILNGVNGNKDQTFSVQAKRFLKEIIQNYTKDDFGAFKLVSIFKKLNESSSVQTAILEKDTSAMVAAMNSGSTGTISFSDDLLKKLAVNVTQYANGDASIGLIRSNMQSVINKYTSYCTEEDVKKLSSAWSTMVSLDRPFIVESGDELILAICRLVNKVVSAITTRRIYLVLSDINEEQPEHMKPIHTYCCECEHYEITDDPLYPMAHILSLYFEEDGLFSISVDSPMTAIGKIDLRVWANVARDFPRDNSLFGKFLKRVDVILTYCRVKQTNKSDQANKSDKFIVDDATLKIIKDPSQIDEYKKDTGFQKICSHLLELKKAQDEREIDQKPNVQQTKISHAQKSLKKRLNDDMVKQYRIVLLTVAAALPQGDEVAKQKIISWNSQDIGHEFQEFYEAIFFGFSKDDIEKYKLLDIVLDFVKSYDKQLMADSRIFSDPKNLSQEVMNKFGNHNTYAMSLGRANTIAKFFGQPDNLVKYRACLEQLEYYGIDNFVTHMKNRTQDSIHENFYQALYSPIGINRNSQQETDALSLISQAIAYIYENYTRYRTADEFEKLALGKDGVTNYGDFLAQHEKRMQARSDADAKKVEQQQSRKDGIDALWGKVDTKLFTKNRHKIATGYLAQLLTTDKARQSIGLLESLYTLNPKNAALKIRGWKSSRDVQEKQLYKTLFKPTGTFSVDDSDARLLAIATGIKPIIDRLKPNLL